jgi:hypothetical protein
MEPAESTMPSTIVYCIVEIKLLDLILTTRRCSRGCLEAAEGARMAPGILGCGHPWQRAIPRQARGRALPGTSPLDDLAEPQHG